MDGIQRATTSNFERFPTFSDLDPFFFFATYFEVLDLGHGSPGRFGGGAGGGGAGVTAYHSISYIN